MDVWMDGCVDEWMDARVDACVDALMGSSEDMVQVRHALCPPSTKCPWGPHSTTKSGHCHRTASSVCPGGSWVLGSPGADAPRRLLWGRIYILCYSPVLLVYLRRLLWSSGPVGRPAVILCYRPAIMNCEATVTIGFPDQLLKRISITHGSNEVFSLHCFHYVAKPFPRACNYELF